MNRIAALLLSFAVACAALANGASPVTTVILVRHAEKVTDASLTDPPLTEAGQLRARELARVLGESGIDAIFTTPFARTRGTAGPIASAVKLTPVEIKTGATYAADVAAKIRAEHAGQTVLVVGHSNTTQNVIKALGLENAPAIAESTYDDLFIVTLAEGSAPRLTWLRYGVVAR